MKVKDVINEGFVSSFAKELMPSALRKVIDTPYKKQAELDPMDIAKSAYQKYGHNPEFINPKTKRPIFPNRLGYLSWLSPYDLSLERKKIIASLSDAEKAALPDELKAQLGITL